VLNLDVRVLRKSDPRPVRSANSRASRNSPVE
jgi:hypothetical protein